MRYSKEHKQVTRQRIIETAGRRFKRDGIDGSGISTLMADAGLTNGAFYAHFESTDEIMVEYVLERFLYRLAASPLGREDFRAACSSPSSAPAG